MMRRQSCRTQLVSCLPFAEKAATLPTVVFVRCFSSSSCMFANNDASSINLLYDVPECFVKLTTNPLTGFTNCNLFYLSRITYLANVSLWRYDEGMKSMAEAVEFFGIFNVLQELYYCETICFTNYPAVISCAFLFILKSHIDLMLCCR